MILMHKTQRKLLIILNKIDFNKMSLRDIGFLVGENHPQKIKYHLEKLIDKGLIIKTENGYEKEKDNYKIIKSLENEIKKLKDEIKLLKQRENDEELKNDYYYDLYSG